MANSVLTLDLSQFDTLKDRLTNMSKELAEGVDASLYADAQDIATIAKGKAPVNFGGLRAAISTSNDKFLEKHVTVNAFYAAFTEFGTGAYAAAYVGTLPSTWQEYALKFKGQKGGTFEEMIQNIFKWIKNKGLRLEPKQFEQGDTFRAGKLTKPKKPKKMTIEEGQQQLAYIISVSILKNGIKPQPFLFPAYEITRPEIINHIEEILKNLGK